MLQGVALAALVVVLAAGSIDTDVYEGGEAREGLVAREMVETGDWILPLWNGTVVPSKPPLFHWLVAAGARATGAGVSERTLRAPSVVLAGVVVLLVFAAGVAWGGPEVGFLAALVLATTPQFIDGAGDGRVDMTLCTAVVGAQVALVESLRRRSRGAPLVLAVCLALAMLAKGPVGPGLVGLTALALAARERRLGPVLGLVRPLPVLIFLVLAGGWYGLAVYHRGWDFVAKQILSENGEALLGGARFPHRSVLFYVPRLFAGGLPWTLLLPWAIVRGWQGPLARRYCVLWAMVVFTFFSLAPLKRGAYLLPLRPAVAMLIGWWLADAARERWPAGRLVPALRAVAIAVCVSSFASAAVATGLARGWVPLGALSDLARAHAVDIDTVIRVLTAGYAQIMVLGSIAAVAAALAARALAGERWMRAAGATAATVACGTLLIVGVLTPARAAQNSVRSFALAVAQRVGPGEPLGLLMGSEEIPFLFYVGRHVPVLGEARRHPPQVGAGYYVLDPNHWDQWDARPGWEEVLRGAHRFSRHRQDLMLVRRR